MSAVLVGCVLLFLLHGDGLTTSGTRVVACEARVGLDGLILMHTPEGTQGCVVPTRTAWIVTWFAGVLPYVAAVMFLTREDSSMETRTRAIARDEDKRQPF